MHMGYQGTASGTKSNSIRVGQTNLGLALDDDNDCDV
jgi:hypothetical protein